MSTADSNRQNLLKQMKVRTKFKKDKSWIHQQSSEDERDEIPSPMSPQLKSLEGRKFVWSPTPDSKPERNSGTFTAKEVVISSSSPTVQTSKQFSYSSTETTKSPSTTSQPSPPPSTTGGRTNTSYIIRGQPFNAVSQVKSPPNFNGYQQSAVQPRTSNSLPRVPSATGHKMSTEEYKKLAPYNVRNRSTDQSDDEAPTTQQEQVTRTEQASSVLRNTSPRDRSYVISAAKRNSGIGTHDTPSPFVGQRVQIQDEETSPNKKSQTLPKTLSSYLYDDHKRAENHWTETQPRPPTSQATPSRVSDRSSSPILTSYSTSNIVETKKSAMKPEPAKVTIVRQESNDTKDITKPGITTTRKERVETTKKSDAHPENLASYLYNDVNRFEKNWTSNPPTQATSQTTRTGTTKKSEALPDNLASYLYDDVNRFEKSQKLNASTQSTSQTVTTRATDRPESPKLVSWSNNSESRTSAVKPGPGKITVLHGESETRDPSIPRLTSSTTERSSSNIQPGPGKIRVLIEDCDDNNKESPRPSVESRSTTRRTESKDVPDSLKLTSSSLSTRATENTRPNIQAGPGKISLIRDESDIDNNGVTNRTTETTYSTTRAKVTIETINESPSSKPAPRMEAKPKEAGAATTSKDGPDSLKLTSSSLSTRATENTRPNIQAGPGKISLIRDESDIDNNGVTNRTTETTYSTTRAKVTIETINESPSSKPAPRMEAKPKEVGAATTSDTQQDLISWSDLNTRVAKERSVTPTPVPRQTNKDSEKSAGEPPLLIISPELNSTRTNQPPKPAVITCVDETEVNDTRYRDSESLNESNNRSPSGDRRVTVITSKTETERPRTPEQRSSSPRPTPRPRESLNTTVTESIHRVPDTIETTMLEASPSRSSSRTTVTTTRSTNPVYTDYMEDSDKRSTRTVSSSREKITTMTSSETRYEKSSEASQNEPQSPSNKGVLFVKEYVNSRESLKSPTASGNFPDFSNDFDRVSYSSSSSYLYSSAPQRSDESPCTYCGREIKDGPKIILEHLNIYCHELCFKCGICHKPMGDLVDSLFIHRDVVHCESCYEKLF
ncbi:zinc finger protein 185 [Bufo bufo]|uniref:zinc finger protein 185 n=1 Tax=Bufo bufo TaxID=8384 RepID=UPI001ABE4AFE|nr:zinc finger protein 185 [Bufo bufo]